SNDGFAAGLDAPAAARGDGVSDADGSAKPAPVTAEAAKPAEATDAAESTEGDANLDEFGRPKPVANYVVHVYEHGRLKRTLDRDFTPEDAEAFATEYSRTAKSYGRSAVAGKKEAEPTASL
ncbi:MAG: hypothetical protein AAGB00_12825, partial [Planctomycetota bacterium]